MFCTLLISVYGTKILTEGKQIVTESQYIAVVITSTVLEFAFKSGTVTNLTLSGWLLALVASDSSIGRAYRAAGDRPLYLYIARTLLDDSVISRLNRTFT